MTTFSSKQLIPTKSSAADTQKLFLMEFNVPKACYKNAHKDGGVLHYSSFLFSTYAVVWEQGSCSLVTSSYHL
jgi:hypothetical protein